jgi:hypothetical protein
MEQEAKQLREVWLEQAASFMIDFLVGQGLPSTDVRVSCGWPSRGGLTPRRTVVGQCFPPHVCSDGRPQIFISPRIADSIEVLGTLLHELLHASIGCEYGHGKKFSQAAKKVGLVRPWTAISVGDRLRPFLEQFIAHAGSYPHAAIQTKPTDAVGSRLRLSECNCQPPIKVRVASDVLQARCLMCNEVFCLVSTSK